MASVTYRRSGFTISPPADSDFGQIPLYTQASRTIPANDFGNIPAVVLSVSDQSPAFGFSLPNNVPQPGPDPCCRSWTVNFRPMLAGPARATLTISSMSTDVVVCPPNTFTVTGVGIAP